MQEGINFVILAVFLMKPIQEATNMMFEMFWSKLGIELLWRFTSLLFQTFDLMIFDYAQKPLCSRSGQSLWSIKLPLFLNVKTDLCNISDRTHLLPCSKICRIFSSFFMHFNILGSFIFTIAPNFPNTKK